MGKFCYGTILSPREFVPSRNGFGNRPQSCPILIKHLSINNLALWYGNQAHNHCQTAKLFLDKY